MTKRGMKRMTVRGTTYREHAGRWWATSADRPDPMQCRGRLAEVLESLCMARGREWDLRASVKKQEAAAVVESEELTAEALRTIARALRVDHPAAAHVVVAAANILDDEASPMKEEALLEAVRVAAEVEND